MGIIGKDYHYKIIRNFLSEDERKLLAIYCEIKHRTNFSNFDTDQTGTADTAYYGDPIMESLMLKKKNLMEKESGLKLLPTYSYWRAYSKYSNLSKHIDRPSCEISCTVWVDGDTHWPIFMDGRPINLEKGDAAIYMGTMVNHWREELQGDHQFQTFLHYVNAEGKHKDLFMDKRRFWGLQQNDN